MTAAAAKKERLTMYSLQDKLVKHGFQLVEPGDVTTFAQRGKTVVCVFTDEKNKSFWTSMYWHTMNADKRLKSFISSITKSGIDFTSGGKIIPRTLEPDYKFLGYPIATTVIAFFRNQGG
jgi:hypothetical protein